VTLSLTESGASLLANAPSTLQDQLRDRFGELQEWEQLQILYVLHRLVTLMDARDIEAAPVLDTGLLIED
jgi:DNA-binding MarR family transcriptional regulator